jgi:hypothetical protein
MLFNQLSIYITDFVIDLVKGSNFIRGLDFDISYSRYSGGTVNDPTAYTSNELQTRLRVMVSDRWSIQAGGNFDVGGNTSTVYSNNSGLIAGEFVIEYTLTKDRRLSIRAYNSTEPDVAGGRRTIFGAGLSFRKEFDTLDELFSSRKKK